MKVTPETPEFISFLAGCQRISDQDLERNYPSLPKEQITFEDLQKRIRVVRRDSVHCFVCKETGNVLKAASYKAPAKHARGNIFDSSNGLAKMGPYGPAYLK